MTPEELLRHLIRYVRSEHEHHRGIDNPQVDSLLLEAHLMELLGRLTYEREQPLRTSFTGHTMHRQIQRNTRAMYEAQIESLTQDWQEKCEGCAVDPCPVLDDKPCPVGPNNG